MTRIENFAFIDELTGLRNKKGLLHDYQEKDLTNQHFIYVDIDDFKKMNRIFGVDAVDQMLVRVSATLQDYCGKSDVYRISGGQFLLVTESHVMCEPSELQKILIQPVEFDNIQVVINASICILDHDDFPDSPLNGVLKLMQVTIDVAKMKGKNQLVYANKKTKESYLEKKAIAYNLVRGVKNKEFYPKFQPFMDTFTHEVIGFEAVSRWDLDGMMLRPKQFLEAAEWTGLIYDIELQIFNEAIKFLRELKDDKKVKLSKRFKAAIHFSAYTLKRLEISDLIEVLDEYDIKQSDIIIETREQHISDIEAFNKILELGNNRFVILLDDYSNENASLSSLAELKIDSMKLDKHLLDKIDNDQEYTRMMNVYKFLVDIAKKFHITVVSDGIDSEQNAKLIRELDVHIGQGNLYSRAIVKEEFVEFLLNNKKRR